MEKMCVTWEDSNPSKNQGIRLKGSAYAGQVEVTFDIPVSESERVIEALKGAANSLEKMGYGKGE